MKKLFLLFLAGLLVLSTGCIFDGNNDDDEPDAVSIDELSMGGGVFLIEDLGYGIANIGVFDDITPFNSAEVYVNGVKLSGQSGIYSNLVQIPIEQLNSDGIVRIVVHALGDSVVKEIIIPEKPVIVKPVDGATPSIEESLEIEIDFPGDHQLIAMTLSEQDQVAFGAETSEEKLKIVVPAEKLIKAGSSILNAYSANTSSEIPDNFQIVDQFDVFLVASLSLRTIEFTE